MDNSIYCKISTELLFSACLVSMYFVFRIIFMRLCGKKQIVKENLKNYRIFKYRLV